MQSSRRRLVTGDSRYAKGKSGLRPMSERLAIMAQRRSGETLTQTLGRLRASQQLDQVIAEASQANVVLKLAEGARYIEQDHALALREEESRNYVAARRAARLAK